ncbi:uncharacterized protein LOC126897415 [Daktulosphaira vitifoliae]|uniref:uncharacterized protein LOC126897415 n=1 Tax=Daktulosphaira vitifoliae TaxID=58002 RepID=UPI0021AAD2BB|nr:uncharacterized protein LOC126897415 [Daktulosphaira vitifoliae]
MGGDGFFDFQTGSTAAGNSVCRINNGFSLVVGRCDRAVQQRRFGVTEGHEDRDPVRQIRILRQRNRRPTGRTGHHQIRRSGFPQRGPHVPLGFHHIQDATGGHQVQGALHRLRQPQDVRGAAVLRQREDHLVLPENRLRQPGTDMQFSQGSVRRQERHAQSGQPDRVDGHLV